ncbi:MAG: hypothetical protein FJ171_06060 [Gammaproteobacteria bacterium]|nr:hypothetical protein [Gammaproteobacteria bacterium]
MRTLITGISACLVLFAATPATRAWAHAGDEILPVRLAVTEWASALQGRDKVAMETLLSEQFPQKAAYIATLPLTPVTRVDLRHATLNIKGTTASFTPVIIYPMVNMLNPVALSLSLGLEGSDWRIVAIAPAPDVPDEAKIRNSVLQRVAHDVKVTLRDAGTSGPISARIHVRDQSGDYWPPQGHARTIAEGWREDVGGDVIVGGRVYAYVPPEFTLQLPDGRYEMEIVRGPEYVPEHVTFSVSPGNVPGLAVSLERWIHMASRGWFSGDTHTHFLSPHSARLEAEGEDLNVVNVLLSSGGNYFSSIADFTGGVDPVSDEDNIVYVSEETRHDFLGHTVLLNLKELIYPFGWGEPDTGVHGGYDHPTMAHQADMAHAQGGLVAWAHMPFPNGELPIDAALNKIDAVEAVVFGNPLLEHPAWNRRGEWTPPPVSPLKLWYSLLNVGIDLPGLGSTDKMWNSQVVGSVRTYVKVDGPLTYQKWVDGIQAGRTFISSGAMIDFSVDGKLPGTTIERGTGGKLPFRAVVDSYQPVERIEVLVNGAVAATLENTEKRRHLDFEGEVAADGSSWIAARAYSRQELPYQYHDNGTPSIVFAHSSPVYVEVGTSERRSASDAAYLAEICERTIRWAKTAARYHSESQRAEVVGLYERARAFYLEQMGAGNEAGE